MPDVRTGWVRSEVTSGKTAKVNEKSVTRKHSEGSATLSTEKESFMGGEDFCGGQFGSAGRNS